MNDLEILRDPQTVWDGNEENLAPLLKVSPGVSPGEIKRNVNGVNGGPLLYFTGAHRGATGNGMKWRFRSLGAAHARLHDDALTSRGSRIVDIDKIFANENADAEEPVSYYFIQTDDYIRGIRECGTDIVYRLGPSIEHTVGQYFAHEPKNWDKWADICIHIIRHYNHGWNNGFEWNIRYWEIWNEPANITTMWMEPFENYCRFYAHVSRRIKAACPGIMIGGPGGSVHHGPKLELYLRTIREAGAPLDFFSVHAYFSNPAMLVNMLLPSSGWWLKELPPECEIHLNEWHYVPGNAFFQKYFLTNHHLRKSNDVQTGMHGANSAAFSAYALILFQDLKVEVANYYTAFGLYGLITEELLPTAEYNVFLFYAELLTHYPHRIEATCDSPRSRVLAGMDDAGRIALLIASFESDAPEIRLDLGDVEITDDIRIQAVNTSQDIEIRYPAYIQNGIAGFEKLNRSEIFLVTGLKRREKFPC